ncbi:MAG: TGS domain-containing protein, partial [Candidatus Thermoplasmatota archaeon]
EEKKYPVIPTSAESELALTHAADKGLIKYKPGDNDFKILKKDKLSEKQKKALEYIRTHVLKKYGSTGIQKCIEKTVEMLDLIVVYPVEDEKNLTDKEGRVLPDAYLVPKGTTALDLAYIVHSDIGENFIRAIDARTNRVIGSDQKLKDNDVITIVADT